MQADSLPTLLLTPKQTAEALSIGERTLWRLTAPRGPLPCVRIGRSVRYDPVDLAAWIAASKETIEESLTIKLGDS